jgi:hypothetical protein
VELIEVLEVQYEQKIKMYWIYLLPSTQQTIGYNGFITTCFDSHESSSGYVQNLRFYQYYYLQFLVLEFAGRCEVVDGLTLTLTKFFKNIYQEMLLGKHKIKEDSKPPIRLICIPINYYSSTFSYSKIHAKTHKFYKVSRKRILLKAMNKTKQNKTSTLDS